MLHGFTTLNVFADDVAAAREWYAELLGIRPYFERPDASAPAYVEFRIGAFEHELGIMDRRIVGADRPATPGGVVAFWHVDDLDAAMRRLIAHGATEHWPVTDREAGFRTAAIVDPFGNVLGLMYSPHFIETRARLAARGDADRGDARGA